MAIGGSEANRRIRYVAQKTRLADNKNDLRAIPLTKIESFPKWGADILIAPLSVICRGHNIVNRNGESAISSIWVLVRPLPPTDDIARALAHVSYEANLAAPSGDTVTARMDKSRRHAEGCLHEFFRGAGPFSFMPPKLRHALLCDVLVELVQLAGRCRRGGTDVGFHLVDGAFTDDDLGWKKLMREAFKTRGKTGVRAKMERTHGAFTHALKLFAQKQD
jgi:hypothetical protein